MRRDQGFTVAELVVAVGILFFVVTALFGLVSASTTTSVSAKQRALAVDAGSSYIEDIRAMPYEAVGVVGAPLSEPTGTLVPTTTTRNNITTTIDPEVSWVNDLQLPGEQDYKKVVLTVTATAPSVGPFTHVVTTYVRNTATNPQSDFTDLSPTIRFTPGTPAEGAVIYGTANFGFGAIAGHESTDGILTVVRLIGGGGLLQTSGGDRAEWGPNLHEFTTTPNPFYWDTTKSRETSPGSGVWEPLYPDGPITLVAEAIDTQNDRTYVQRHYVIDNSPPGAPSDVTLTSPNPQPVPLRITWVPGVDGTALATNHSVTVYQQNSTSTDMASWANLGSFVVATPEGNPPTMSYDYTEPAFFSRYAAAVAAVGPRSSSAPVLGGPHTTRPSISGTATIAGNDEKHSLTITPPTFPCVGQVRYSWSVSVDGGAWTTPIETTTGNSFTRTVADKNRTYRYRATVTYTPAGPDSTASVTHTQICGQENKVSTDFTFVQVWTQWW